MEIGKQYTNEVLGISGECVVFNINPEDTTKATVWISIDGNLIQLNNIEFIESDWVEVN
jgi:hypothetical protein